jgi:hypothetical protein
LPSLDSNHISFLKTSHPLRRKMKGAFVSPALERVRLDKRYDQRNVRLQKVHIRGRNQQQIAKTVGTQDPEISVILQKHRVFTSVSPVAESLENNKSSKNSFTRLAQVSMSPFVLDESKFPSSILTTMHPLAGVKDSSPDLLANINIKTQIKVTNADLDLDESFNDLTDSRDHSNDSPMKQVASRQHIASNNMTSEAR